MAWCQVPALFGVTLAQSITMRLKFLSESIRICSRMNSLRAHRILDLTYQFFADILS